MIHIEAGIYVRVQQLAGRAHPLPLESGFNEETAYRALGIYSPSETSECYFVLANDRDEPWFISNRHLRVIGVLARRLELRFLLPSRLPGSEPRFRLVKEAWRRSLPFEDRVN